MPRSTRDASSRCFGVSQDMIRDQSRQKRRKAYLPSFVWLRRGVIRVQLGVTEHDHTQPTGKGKLQFRGIPCLTCEAPQLNSTDNGGCISVGSAGAMTDTAPLSAGESRPLPLQRALEGLAASLDGQLRINRPTEPPIDPPCWNGLLKGCSAGAASNSSNEAASTATNTTADPPCYMGEIRSVSSAPTH